MEKKSIFEVLFVYFESDTVESDCPIQSFRKMMKYLKIKYRLLVYLTNLDILKKSS